jgi:hypothetical protein
MKRLVSTFILFALVGYAVTVLAQAPAAKPEAKTAAPLLSQVQQLQLQNVMLRLELVQREAQTLVQSMQVPGYDLDLQGMRYVPKPEPKPEPVKK